MAKWLLVDGFNLMYRSFHALPELTRADGFPTGALHGWVKAVWKLEDMERPYGMLVFFDLGGSQDRLAIHPEYKAQREEMPEALVKQIEPVKALTRAMGHVGIEEHGVESDDLLASEAVDLANKGHEVVIVSSDKDFAQLVNDQIKIMLPPPTANPKLGWRLMDAAGVREKFGVEASQIRDYLSLIGDTSDNIPGIDGVGPKTASKWLAEFKSLEGVIANASTLKPDRFRETVAAHADRLRLNYKLVTLNLALKTTNAVRGEPAPAALFKLLEEMEMRTSLKDAQMRYKQPELF